MYRGVTRWDCMYCEKQDVAECIKGNVVWHLLRGTTELGSMYHGVIWVTRWGSMHRGNDAKLIRCVLGMMLNSSTVMMLNSSTHPHDD